MTVALGKTVFTVGSSFCTGLGIEWSCKDLGIALAGPVRDVLFDSAGNSDIERILRGVVETEFEQEGLRAVLASPESIEDWRVG